MIYKYINYLLHKKKINLTFFKLEMKSHMEEEIEMDDYENIFNPNFKSQFNINESNEYMIKAIPSFDLDNSYATCEIDSQVTKVDISFISTSNNKEKEKNENLINILLFYFH